MRTSVRLPSIAGLAILLLCLAASVGSANSGIGLEPSGRTVTLTSEALVFSSSFARVTCPVTLTGSLEKGFQKVETILIGPITGATLAERSCTGGTARIARETLPWEVEYFSFAGTLPNITSLNLGIEEISALVEALGVGCLFRGTPRARTGRGTEVTELRLDETVRIPVVTRLSAFCPSEGTLSGTFRVSPTVRLSLQESEARSGSTIQAEPNPLRIPAANPNGIITLRAISNAVEVGRIRRIINAGEPAFTVSGCEQTDIMVNGVCSVTVTKGARPSGGVVRITYRNNQGEILQTAVTVVIE